MRSGVARAEDVQHEPTDRVRRQRRSSCCSSSYVAYRVTLLVLPVRLRSAAGTALAGGRARDARRASVRISGCRRPCPSRRGRGLARARRAAPRGRRRPRRRRRRRAGRSRRSPAGAGATSRGRGRRGATGKFSRPRLRHHVVRAGAAGRRRAVAGCHLQLPRWSDHRTPATSGISPPLLVADDLDEDLARRARSSSQKKTFW